jgi:WD40 repeat protein
VLVLDGEHPVAELAFTPDGTRLIVGRVDEHPLNVYPPEVWALATGARIRLPKPDGASELALRVHPAGRHAFIAYGNALCAVCLTDGTVQELSHTSSWGSASGVIASPDGKWVVFANRMTEDVRHFYGLRCDVSSEPVCMAEWSVGLEVPHERLGGFVGADRFVTLGTHRANIRDAETGEVRATAKHTAIAVTGLVTSPDGGLLAARSSTNFYVWDTTTWQKRFQLAWVSRFQGLSKYTFHPTRPILAAIQRGQTLVKFLDTATGKPVSKFQWKLGEMKSVCFSPDGTLAAAGSAKGKIVVWDVD